MKALLVLGMLITVSAQAECMYNSRARDGISADQHRQIQCEINWRCTEHEIVQGGNNPAELEALAEYSRTHQCNHELKLADLVRRQVSQQTASACDTEISTQDLSVQEIFTASNVIAAGECGPGAPEATRNLCKAQGFTCEIAEQNELNNPENCSVTVIGTKILPNTPAGQQEARCRKINRCADRVMDASMGLDENVFVRRMNEMEELRRKHNCPTVDDALLGAGIDRSDRGNSEELRVVPDAPVDGSTRRQ